LFFGFFGEPVYSFLDFPSNSSIRDAV
jgi:hypothetical protein